MRSKTIPVRLFTIGYQGRTLDKLLSKLALFEIDIVVDVRHTAWSRKPGFSKSQLTNALATKGIEYVHLPQFGSSASMRQDLHDTNDWDGFAAAYGDYLNTLNRELETAMLPFQGKKICFLCMEADASQCHRSILAAEVCKRNMAIRAIHL